MSNYIKYEVNNNNLKRFSPEGLLKLCLIFKCLVRKEPLRNRLPHK